MDYTHKIAELCNGASQCEVILTQQFIHKCSDEATYLFISYQCINSKINAICLSVMIGIIFLDSTIVDVCSSRSMTSMNSVNLISPAFPNEYPNNVNCTCRVEPTESYQRTLPIAIDVEVREFGDFF